LAAGVFLLSACGGRISNTNWAGLSSDGERVYLAYGPRVLAYDPATESQSWIFPAENGAVQFFSPPSVEGERVVFGDYGQSGGFLSPRVTVSIYAVENVDSGTPGQIWTNSEAAGDKIVAPPLQVGNQLFVGTADNHVLALDAADGSLQWDFETGHAIWGQPALREGILYVTSMDWSVYALDAATGDLIWQTELGGALPSRPILGEDLMYVSSYDGNVHALDIASGEPQWAAPAADWVWGAAALADGAIYYTDIQGNIYAADAQTGEELWTKSSGVNVQTNPVIVGDTLYIASQTAGDTPGGALTAYKIADGEEVWSQATPAPILAPPVVVGDDTIVVAPQSANAFLIGYDLATGQELWRFSSPESTN
jgi:outer membrane protein assembly factor BamB